MYIYFLYTGDTQLTINKLQSGIDEGQTNIIRKVQKMYIFYKTIRKQ